MRLDLLERRAEKKSELVAFAPIGSFIDNAAYGLDYVDRPTLLSKTVVV